MNVIGPVALLVMAIAFAHLERRRWGTLATPGVVLVGGYAAVAALTAMATRYYQFAEVHAETYLVLSSFTLVCFLVSKVVARMTGWKPEELMVPAVDQGRLSRLALIGTVAVFVPLAFRSMGNNDALWSSDSAESLSYGVVGHLHAALGFAVVWYSVANRDTAWVRFALLGISCLSLSLYPVKGWTLIPITAALLARIMRTTRLGRAAAYLIAVGLAGVVVFFGIYISRASTSSNLLNAVVPAVLEHFVFYLTSGFMGLNAVIGGLRLEGGAEVLFAPFVNLTSAVLGSGKYLNIVSPVYVDGMPDHPTLSNVYSLLGTLAGHTNPVIGAALAALVLAIVYLLLVVGWRTRSTGMRALALYQCAVLAFAWFDYYYYLLRPYEVVGLAILTALAGRRGRPQLAAAPEHAHGTQSRRTSIQRLPT